MMFYTPSSWATLMTASAASEGGGDEASPDKGARQAGDGRGRRSRPADEAYWAAVQKMLGLDEGEVFEIIAEDMTYFGFGQI